MNLLHSEVVRAIESRKTLSPSTPIVLLVTEKDLPQVRNLVSASLGSGFESLGNAFQTEAGEIKIRTYNESPNESSSFELCLCMGGVAVSSKEIQEKIARWRDASE